MNASAAAYWRAMASGVRSGIIERCVVLLLFPCALIYAVIQRMRARCYATGLLTSRKLPKPVVSIGNLSVGGTGKTPVTAWVAAQLLHKGYRVAVLSRGYGGVLEGTTAIVSDGAKIRLSAAECGDEPYLLARNVPGLMVVIGSERYAAGMLALEQLDPDVFLLDDGFQHLRLQRDLDIVLVDCTRPFGNGWTLPAGLLREPVSALKRSDLIIRTRCKAQDDAAMLLGIPCCNARHELGDAVSLAGNSTLPLDALAGKKVVAFAGIAEPEAFFRGLRKNGLELVETIAFPDHIRYTADTLALIHAAMRRNNAAIALTTEKDAVKLASLPNADEADIFQVGLHLVIDKPETVLARMWNLLQN